MKISTYTTLFSIFCILAVAPAWAASGKKALDHSVYAQWNQIQRPQLSADGRWASYEVNPQQGDGWLHLINLQTQERDSIARGSQAAFSPGSDFLSYLIKPEAETVRQAKLDGKSREEMPQDHLGVIRLYDDERFLFENVRSFAVAQEDLPWMAFHQAVMPEDTLEGTRLTIYNPVSGDTHHVERVTSYTLSTNGRLAAFIQAEDADGPYQVQVFDTSSQEKTTLFTGKGAIEQLSMNDEGSQLAFLHAGDGEANDDGGEDGQDDIATYSLYYWDRDEAEAVLLVTADSPGVPEGWSPSPHAAPGFTDAGTSFFFGTAPTPEPAREDTLLQEEKHELDVWHYEDPLIQPMQLVQKEAEERRTYAAIYHLDEGRMVQLADEEMPDITANQYGNGQYEMGESKLPYLIPNSFESGDYRDVYLVDVATGERELLLEKHRGSVHLSTTGDPRLSPDGNYLLYYDQSGKNWFTINLETRTHTNITADIDAPLYDELHDTPSHPDPHGIAGWIEGDRYVLIYDRFDIWRVDPAG